MTLTPQHKMARTAHKNGICVVPAREDGSKAPLGLWLNYQKERPEPEQIDAWYENGRRGIGVICGRVSGNLTMLECESWQTWELLRDNAEASGLDVLDRIAQGWMETTPGGGVHIYYRCDDQRGNKKLARKDNGDGTYSVLIETRGEGGFSVIAPSGGGTHPTGNEYVAISGGPASTATITPDEQRDLWQLARVFDESEVREPIEPKPVGYLRPGDDYNNRASWREILEPHGWRFLFERAGVWYLRRPGKDRGISATVNWGGLGCLRNFSSSVPLDERMYTKFGVYTVLNHRGDFRSAARELAGQGYGQRDQVALGSEESDGEPRWRQPDPVERPGFPQFPVHALPESIRGFCRAVADSVQVPSDYPAMTMLGALSVACRGRFEITVPGTDYVEPLVLQTVLFAESGTRKSAAFSMVKRPLTAYERQRRRDDEIEFAAWEARGAQLEREIAKQQKQGYSAALMALIREQAEHATERPVVTRLIADDVTPERLGTIIAEQRGPIGIMAPEGGFFGNIAGRYNQGIPNLEYVLRGHNGEPLIIDRMGREVFVPASFVTLAISLQPEIVRELSTVPGFKGKGMAARLLPAFPTSLVGQRDVRKASPVDPDEQAIWRSVLLTLLGQADDCPHGEDGYEAYRITLGRSAREVYYQYAEHVERQLAKGGGLHGMRDWGGKMVGHALRIAGLFHLVEHGSDALAYPVSADTLVRSIDVMEYFVPHAKHFLGALDGITYGENLQDVLAILREMDEPIYRSTLIAKLRTHKSFRGQKEAIHDALDELEILGYIRVVPGSKAVIELNPSVDRIEPYATFTPKIESRWSYQEGD